MKIRSIATVTAAAGATAATALIVDAARRIACVLQAHEDRLCRWRTEDLYRLDRWRSEDRADVAADHAWQRDLLDRQAEQNYERDRRALDYREQLERERFRLFDQQLGDAAPQGDDDDRPDATG